jgi:hypothetical protein
MSQGEKRNLADLDALSAKLYAWAGRTNARQENRAREVARAHLREVMKREPQREEVDTYARALLGRAVNEHRRRGGVTPPAGHRGGLERDGIVAKVAELCVEDPDGRLGWPTQATTSVKLGLDESGRRIRQVQGPRGWAGIVQDAQTLRARARS